MQANDVTAIVLAGGLGTRVRHLLPDLPKPMAPVAGRPFLEWVVRYLASQGIRQVVLSTGYRAAAIEQHFQPCPVPGMQVLCCPEPTALGTAGGCLYAAAQVTEIPKAWLVLNGDSLVFANLESLLGCLRDPTVQGAVLGVMVTDASRYGRLTWDKADRLTGFAEKCPGTGVVNAGVYVLRPHLLAELSLELSPLGLWSLNPSPLSFEYEVFPRWIQAGHCLKVHRTRSAFLDIGTPETLAMAETFIQQHWPWKNTPVR